MSDLITFLTFDKVIENNQLVNSKVYMNFRSDGAISCGGRLKGLPDRIEWGAKNYIQVFEQGVKASILKPVNIEELKLEQEQKLEADVQSNIHKLLDLPNAIKGIKTLMKQKLKSGKIDNAFIIDALSKHGLQTPDDIEDITIANEILKVFESA